MHVCMHACMYVYSGICIHVISRGPAPCGVKANYTECPVQKAPGMPGIQLRATLFGFRCGSLVLNIDGADYKHSMRTALHCTVRRTPTRHNRPAPHPPFPAGNNITEAHTWLDYLTICPRQIILALLMAPDWESMQTHSDTNKHLSPFILEIPFEKAMAHNKGAYNNVHFFWNLAACAIGAQPADQKILRGTRCIGLVSTAALGRLG